MDLANKNIIVVGANGGLATETIRHLIKDGAENITLACRTFEKAIDLQNRLHASSGKGKLNLTPVGGFDMHDQQSIEKAVTALQHNFDIVFLAAGGAVFKDTYQSIKNNGYEIEKTAYQNLFGAHITLNALLKNNKINSNARIVYAGGEGARGIPGMIENPEFANSNALRNYIHLKKTPKYNAMNAIGVSKFLGALWVQKLAKISNKNFEIIWFSPGLTYGTNGLNSMTPVKKWVMENVGFQLMRLIGKAQSPSDGGRKFADAIKGSIGKDGDVLGAPEKQTLGKITDQIPMNKSLSNQALIEELWSILEETSGKFAA